MSNLQDFYRNFREKVRDSEPMKDVYRKIRQVRDDLIQESAQEANDFLDYFKSLPFDKQIEMLVSLYELIFGKE